MQPIEVDGYTYTKEDLEEMRATVIEWRDESMKQWPETILFTTQATHLIAVLYQVIKQYPERDRNTPIP